MPRLWMQGEDETFEALSEATVRRAGRELRLINAGRKSNYEKVQDR